MATRRTDRRRPRTRSPRRTLPEEFSLKLCAVVKRLEATSYAASTIMLALIQENMGRDREFAICLEKQVSDELDQSVEELTQFLRRYTGQKYTPLIRSTMLGWRRGLRLRQKR